MKPEELLEVVYRIIGELVVVNRVLQLRLDQAQKEESNAVQEREAAPVSIRQASRDRQAMGQEVRNGDQA